MNIKKQAEILKIELDLIKDLNLAYSKDVGKMTTQDLLALVALTLSNAELLADSVIKEAA